MKKTKSKKWTLKFMVLAIVCFLAGACIGLLGYHYFFKQNAVSYKVESCEPGFPKFKGSLVSYDKQNKTLNAKIWVNCCGVKVKVEREGSTYKILEKQVGELCRCMCKRKVTIFNVPKDSEIEFLDKDGNRYILSPNLEFCGWSSYGKCNSDEDCIRDDCSHQICRSRFEEHLITTCEWLDCYNAEKFGIACKCVEGRCQWIKE